MPNAKKVEVLVIGGGAAGIAAACSAARAGVDTALIERNGYLGGMATAAQVGTICGAYLRAPGGRFEFGVGGFAREFVEELRRRGQNEPLRFKEGLGFLPYEPRDFHSLSDSLVRKSGVTIHYQATLKGVEKDDSSNKESVRCVEIDSPEGLFTYEPRYIVDCSGEALIATLSRREIRSREREQACAFVFSIEGLPENSPANLRMLVIKSVLESVQVGTLPPEAARISIIPGSERGQRLTIKLNLGVPNISEPNWLPALDEKARSLSSAIVECLKKTAEGCLHARATDLSEQVGIRSSSAYVGIATLSDKTVLSCEKSERGVANGCWPMEIWGEAREPVLNYFRENDYYHIPAEALISRDFENLFCAGRNISAEAGALASARVIGTCLSTGSACGVMAGILAHGGSIDSAVTQIRKTELGLLEDQSFAG